MEYRGYDSAGVVLNKNEEILNRSLGKVSKLEDLMISKNLEHFQESPTQGGLLTGLHPENAHPHGYTM